MRAIHEKHNFGPIVNSNLWAPLGAALKQVAERHVTQPGLGSAHSDPESDDFSPSQTYQLLFEQSENPSGIDAESDRLWGGSYFRDYAEEARAIEKSNDYSGEPAYIYIYIIYIYMLVQNQLFLKWAKYIYILVPIFN